jgi:hypothetical protein
MAVAYNSSIVTDGLVLCLDAANPKSYPGSGTTWFDLSGNGNNGTSSGGTSFSNLNGGCFSFDGTDDEIISTNSSSVQVNAGTIGAWFNGTSNNTGYRGIIAKQMAWGLFLLNNILETYDWGNGVTRTTGITLGNNTWNNAVMTFTDISGTPSNNAKIYLNGRLVLTTTIRLSNHTVTVQIGEANAGQHFNGNIANAFVYNRVLSEDEVQRNFNALRGRFGI